MCTGLYWVTRSAGCTGHWVTRSAGRTGRPGHWVTGFAGIPGRAGCTGCPEDLYDRHQYGSRPTTVGTASTVIATCTSGTAIGGGGSDTSTTGVSINTSQPVGTNKWSVTYWTALGTGANTMTAYVICAN